MSLRSSIATAAMLAAAALPHAAAQSTTAKPEASASAAHAPGAYRSAFDGYRPFGDQPVGNWRNANDTVGRIGGWQAYAREGQGGSAGGAEAMPAGHRHTPSGAGAVASPPASAVSGPGPSRVPAKAAPAGAAANHSGHHAP